MNTVAELKGGSEGAGEGVEMTEEGEREGGPARHNTCIWSP